MNFNIYKYKTWCFLCISGLLSTIFGPLPYLQGCIDFAPYQGGDVSDNPLKKKEGKVFGPLFLFIDRTFTKILRIKSRKFNEI